MAWTRSGSGFRALRLFFLWYRTLWSVWWYLGAPGLLQEKVEIVAESKAIISHKFTGKGDLAPL